MPRIPLSNGPDRLGHVSDSARMRGGPSLSGQHIEVQADEARALRGFGEAISLAGGAISDSLLQYAKTSIEVDNRLAAAEAQNLYRSIQDELQTRMKENPNQFDQFEGWAKDADKRYTEEVKSITDRMTPGYRQLFDEEMRGRRIESVGQQMRIGIQAKTAAQKEKYMYLYKDACSRMDTIQALQLTATAKETGLISKEEAELREKEIGRFVDLEQVKRFCESNPKECLMMLKDYTADGHAFFSNITQEDRDKWIRFSEAEAGRFIQEQDHKFLASIVDGNQLYTRDEIKQMKDAEQITNEQFVRWNKWLDKHDKEMEIADYYSNLTKFASGEYVNFEKNALEELHKKGQISDRQYIRYKELEADLKNKAQQRSAKKLETDKYLFLFDLARSEVSSDPSQNQRWIEAKTKAATEISGGDPKIALELYKEIKSKAEEARNGTDVFGGDNERVLNYIKEKRNQTYLLDPATGTSIAGLKNENAKFYYQAIDFARAELKKGTQADEVIQKLEKRILEFNQHQADQIYNMYQKKRTGKNDD